jgi:acyl carrier protein
MRSRVMEIAAEEINAKPEELSPLMKLSSCFDSLDLVHFIMRLQEELGPIDKKSAIKAETFADLESLYALPS